MRERPPATPGGQAAVERDAVGKRVTAKTGGEEEDGEAGGVAEEHDAEGGAHGSAGVLDAHPTGEVTPTPQDGGGKREDGG